MLVWEGLLEMKTWKGIFPRGVVFWKLASTWADLGCVKRGIPVTEQESPEVCEAFPLTRSSSKLPVTSSPFRSQPARNASGFRGLAKGLPFAETKGVLSKLLAECVKLRATLVLPGSASVT